MNRRIAYGVVLSAAFGLSCNSFIEGGSCDPADPGCDPGGGGGGPKPGLGPDVVVKVGPGSGMDFDPKGDGSGGIKKDPNGNIILDPGNLMGSMQPVIWIANSAEGTVSKFDTRTLKELARYVTHPGGKADPSRTTVSLNGDVVVANRCLQNCDGAKASALKIAGDLSGCVDRNRNGKIDTSQGAGPAAAMAWPAGQPQSPDECVLWLTDLSDGGTQTLPRAAGFDSGLGEIGTNVYIGLYNKQEVLRLDGATGKVLKRINVAPAHPYGIVLDKDGSVWVQGTPYLTKIDVKGGDAVTNVGSSPCPYGIAADARGNIYTAGSTCVARFDPVQKKFEQIDVPGSSFLRGIALDQKNQVWTSDTSNGMYRVDAAAALKVNGSISVSGGGIGAAIDFDGNPWIISQSQSKAYKVNPMTLATQEVATGTQPYTYSDMTGFQLRNAGAPAGVYRRTFPGCGPQTRWFDLTWDISAPSGTEVTVRVRFAASQAELANAMWKEIAKLPPPSTKATLPAPADGHPDFMQVEIAMKAADPKLTPILSALSVGYSCNILG